MARFALPDADDTIVALATPRGRGALAVLRVSGAGTRDVGAAVVDPFHWRPGGTYLAAVRAPRERTLIDRAIVTAFAAPRSFTGEDVLELTTHGGELVPALVLEALLAAGARQALPGEFTRRAVARGKLDLLQAEALADLVDAQSPAMHRLALRQMDGSLTARISGVRGAVLELEALLAYDIDFPEEDQGAVPRERIGAAASALLAALGAMLATARTGELVRSGAVVVLAGPPNSGKSSLFNALIGSARAIVTDVPGTTRDALEAVVELGEWPVRLVDTAGLRDGAEGVERLGIEVAARYLASADAVLVCGETVERAAEAARRIATLTTAPRLVLRTKSDLVANGDLLVARYGAESGLVSERDYIDPPNLLAVSVVTGRGIPDIVDALGALLRAAHPERDAAEPLLTRERHRRAVERAHGEVALFVEAWNAGTPPPIVAAVHLRTAAGALEGLIGAVSAGEVLERVFASFCIGK